jgi:hypothetical protein
MILKEVIQWMLDNGYGLLVNNKFVITHKVNDELFTKPVTQSVELVKTTNEVVKTPTELVKRVEKKKIVTEDEKKGLWNKFIEDAKIPHRVNSGTGVYTVRQWNKPASDILYKIVNNPDIDYQRLVDSTNNYYTTITYKILLTNYLLNNVWEDEYNNYSKTTVKKSNDGSSIFED